MKKIEIYSDGACRGNPGLGGWGALLTYEGHEKRIYGCEQETTNNRMELMGSIAALRVLKEPSDVTLVDRLAICQKRHDRMVERLES
jgi:ribonuclease HI